MKKVYLFLLTVLFLGLNVKGQFADLSFMSDTLVLNLTSNDSVGAEIILQNTGNRDLNWHLVGGMGQDGDAIYFQKTNYADWNQIENQDIFSPEVRITRQDQRGIYNIFSETSHVRYYSPEGTEWAYSKTKDALPGDYDDWLSLTGGNPSSMVGDTVSVHLINEDIYFDVVTHTWTQGANGGGFSWTRWAIYDWLNVEVDSGNVNPGVTDTTTIGVDARGMMEGTYFGWLVFESNDFYDSVIYYPVKLNVTGIPEIGVEYTSHVLDTTFLGDTSFYELNISNYGTAPLTISASAQTSHIQFYESNLELPAPGAAKLYYAFIPTAEVNLIDTIELTTNDPANPVVKIALTGVAQDVPVGGVVGQSSLSETLEVNDSALHYIVMENTGVADLVFNVYAIGDTVYFEKPDYADYENPMYQDLLKDDIRITRANNQPLFNIAQESNFQWGLSPIGTLWSAGRPIDPEFPWGDYISTNYNVTSVSPWSSRGRYMPIYTTDWFKNEFGTLAMYLPEYDEYYSIDMHTWTDGNNGGGFSWTRVAINPGWLDFINPLDRRIPSGESDTIWFYFNSSEMASGDYNATIVVETNELVNNKYYFDANLTVNSYPVISVEDTLINFGEVVINETDSSSITVENLGWDTLYATNISFNSPAFSVPVIEGGLPPGETGELMVYFSPTSEGDYTDTISLYTNDPATPVYKVPILAIGIPSPQISVMPNELYVSLAPDATGQDTLYIGNTGLGNLYWNIGGQNSLESLLERLNSNYTDITDLIPNIHDFSWDIQADNISDGGNDMYDGGNMISTDRDGNNLQYSDNAIVNDWSHFGKDGRYFTRHLPGLFVLAADLNQISSFIINGNLGADGGGVVDGTVLNVNRNGKSYQGFLKRVYNAGDPSVNHLIIIEQSSTASHTFALNTDNDYHEVMGLPGIKRLYYLLYASAGGQYINDATTTDIMNAFIDIFSGIPSWVSPDTLQGITAAGNLDTIPFTFDATGLVEGDHLYAPVFVNSNQPDTIPIQIDLHLHVPGTPELDVTDTILNYGNAYISGVDTIFVPVRNLGTDSLYITSVVNDSSQFWTLNTPIAIERNDSLMLPVYFSPTTNVAYADTMMLYTNDADEPFFTLYLSGTGIYGSEIDVSPLAIIDTLAAGDSVQHMVIIRNTGVEVLTWSVGFNSLPVDFVKPDYANWLLPEFQDSITPTLSITRADQQGLFNIMQQSSYAYDGPWNTEWAQVPTAIATNYNNWRWAVGYNPPSSVGNTYSMHVLDSDRYFDITFNSWTGSNNGGGFSYHREEQAPGWLSLYNMGDTIEPGYTDTLMLTLDATMLNEGEFDGKLLILSNDPDEMLTEVDLNLKVEGEPQIYTYTNVGFGDVYVSDTAYYYIYFANNGSDTLFVDDITHDLPEFGIEQTSLMLLPGQGTYINAWFIPSSADNFVDTLRVFNDTPGDSIRNIRIYGTGVNPPILNLFTNSISDNLTEGDSSLHYVVIGNSGSYQLEWEIWAVSADSDYVEKPDYADWTLPMYQDKVSPSLIITRADNQGLFNIALEGSYNSGTSPLNSEWSPYPTHDSYWYNYNDWRYAVNYNPPSSVGNTYSMHDLTTDKYYDVTFRSWTPDNNGGGFVYSRVEVYPGWIGLPVTSGSVDAGVTDSIDVKLLADSLTTGIHNAKLVLVVTNLGDVAEEIPVQLTVTATAEIAVSETALDFGEIYVNGDSTQQLYIKSVGIDPLAVTEINTPVGYEVYPESFTLNPGDSIAVDVMFNPGFDGDFNGNMSIVSNDPDDSPFLVSLSGTAILPPDILVNPTVLSANLIVDDTTYANLIIRNVGSDSLFYYVTGISGGALAGWLDVSKSADTVLSGEYDTVVVQIVSTGLVSGIYSSFIEIHSNDVEDPLVEIPVVLEIGEIGVVNPIADMRVPAGFVSDTIDLSNVFVHSGGDTLIFSAVSTNTDVATVSILSDTLLLISETGAGSTVITVKAADTTGGKAYDDFNFIVDAPPYVAQPLADIYLPTGFTTEVIDISNVFADANNDPLTYSAVSNDESVVIASTSTHNLILNEVSTGSATVEISATDGMSAPVTDTVLVIINNIPVVSSPIADVTVNNGFGTYNINLASVFTDTDGDVLSYTIDNTNSGVVTAAVANDTLTLTEVGLGTTTITITADDGKMGVVSEEFNFSVNGMPVIDNPLADVDYPIGFGRDTIDISNVFSDPDGDILTLSVSSSLSSVVTASLVGNAIVLSEAGSGSSDITLTANDGKGGVTNEVFVATVNSAPAVTAPLADVVVDEGFGSQVIDLSGVFTDVDGDVIAYSAVSDNTSVVTVSVSGTDLTVTEAGIGTSNITVTASDSDGASGTDEFSFTVNDLIGIDLTEFTSLSVYPNPTSGKIWLQPEHSGLSNITIEIVNTVGQKVFTNTYKVMGAKEMIDLEAFNSGVYYMKIYVNDELKHIEKIVLE